MGTQGQLPFDAPLPIDICAGKHRGHRQSKAANLAVERRKPAQREVIYAYLVTCGPGGETCEALSLILKIPYQSCSGRCAELKRDGRIFETTKEKKTVTGCMATVLVADLFANGGY